jgi:para-nitrobenzyl esterase
MIRFAGALAAALVLSGAARAEAVKARTDAGVVVGEATERAHVFRAVPYAAAPVGALRWAPPAPPRAWPGERDATANGPSCPQPMNADGTPNAFGGANGPVSEDCLQLYVFAPKAAPGPSTKAAVMVWIHGGGHRVGAGWVYDGQNFARDGVVVVSINYRLGPLGYLAHPALTKAAGKDPTGNFGLMDQVAALAWVKRNIAAFGGDPGNVTIFGESAGGASVLALLATPSARGLYHKAIVQSGGGWGPPRTLPQMETAGVAALAQAGAAADATATDLRAIPFEKLVPLAGDYGPFQDGRLMTQTPAEALASRAAADAPLIIGWNSGEDSVAFGGLLAATEADRTPAGRDAFTDRMFGAPARWIAAQAAAGKPAWLYHFSYVGTRFRPRVTTAAHAAEIQYVWEYWGRRTPMSVVSEEDRAMAALMHGCWVSFARTGTPACGTIPWPAYDAKRDQLMEFGSPSGVRSNFRKAQLDAMETAQDSWRPR